MRVASLDRSRLRELWTRRDTLAISLLVLFLDQYGHLEDEDGQTQACLQWDPETIELELESDLDCQVPMISLHKLMASIVVFTTDRFYRNLDDFIKISNVLSGSEFDHESFDPADAAECAWGITEAMLTHPPDDDESEPFAPEIVSYISKVIEDECIIDPPDVLRIGGTSTDTNLPAEWSDDPDMFSAFYHSQKSKSDDIRAILRSRLRLLVQQLESLPLVRGETENVIEKLLRVVKGR